MRMSPLFYGYPKHLSINKRACWMMAFYNGRTRNVLRPEIQTGRPDDAIDFEHTLLHLFTL